MDGATLQQRIYAGYARDVAHTGRAYSHYRFDPDVPVSPLEAGNLLGELYCRFAAEKRFEIPHKYKDATRFLYADGREIEQHDLLVGPFGTFYVADMQPLLPLQAIWCNEVVTIGHPVYVEGVVEPDNFVISMPCFRQLKRLEQRKPEYGSGTAATPIGEWFLFIPVQASLLEQGDIVVDQGGQRYTLDAIDNTEIGVVAAIRQSEV